MRSGYERSIDVGSCGGPRLLRGELCYDTQLYGASRLLSRTLYEKGGRRERRERGDRAEKGREGQGVRRRRAKRVGREKWGRVENVPAKIRLRASVYQASSFKGSQMFEGAVFRSLTMALTPRFLARSACSAREP